MHSRNTALSTILNYYDNQFGCDDFLRIIDWMPYIIELDFDGDKLISKTEHVHVQKEFKGKAREDKQRDDFKRKPQDGHSQLLFGMVLQQNKRGICVCEKSYKSASDK